MLETVIRLHPAIGVSTTKKNVLFIIYEENIMNLKLEIKFLKQKIKKKNLVIYSTFSF